MAVAHGWQAIDKTNFSLVFAGNGQAFTLNS
jgi:hypothetical protein